MNEYFNGKNHRTRPLTLALIQQNIYKGKYRPSNLTHTVVTKKKNLTVKYGYLIVNHFITHL